MVLDWIYLEKKSGNFCIKIIKFCILTWIIASFIILGTNPLQNTSTLNNTMASTDTCQPNNNVTYSRSDLLLIGKEILSQQTKLRITPEVYQTVRHLEICSVKPTRRGIKGGSKAQGSMQSALLGLINARSIVNKTVEISDHIIEHNIDILSITETWLSDHNTHDVELNDICPDGYSIVHVPRLGRRGGGVAVIHKDSIAVKTEPSFKAKSFESIELVLTVSSTCIRLVTVYRPPPTKVNASSNALFMEEFSMYLESLSITSGRVIITGDFNFHMESPTCLAAKTFQEAIDTAGFTQHVTAPTHTSGHMLDLIMSRESDNVVKSTIVSSLISDHHAIHSTLNINRPPLPKRTITYRNLKNMDKDKFRQDIQELPLLKNPMDDIDSLSMQYNSDLESLLDKHAPMQTKSLYVRPLAPWYDDAIHDSRKECKKAEMKWRSTGLTVHRDIYRHHRNKTNSLISNAKKDHFNKKIDDCGTDQKALFKIVNQLLGNKSELKLPTHDSLEDLLTNFSEFFMSKISTIRQTLEEADAPSKNSNIPLEGCHSGNTMHHFKPVSAEDTIKLIKSCPSKSCSLDPIPTWLLKEVVNDLAPPITKLINTSLSTSVFPSSMKKALVTPLLKKQNLPTETLKNYRPVSNLSFVSKLTEKVVASQLSIHMSENELYTPVQSAYRSNHSTETALLKVLNDMLISVDEGNGVMLVLLDLSAAFDTIDHEILINRLSQRLGIKDHALAWFKSYLSERLQSIHLDGQSSAPKYLLFGVPQGSVLGPILFSAYQTPLFDIARRHGVDIHLYADDTQLYVSYNLDSVVEKDSAVRKIENCIHNIKSWMTNNKLKLNDNKTEVMQVSSAWQKSKCESTNLSIGTHSVAPSCSVRNLGVVFDAHLKMDSQVKSVCKNSYCHLRKIGKIRKYLTTKATTRVIHAFVSSRLDHNNSLLHGIPKVHIQKLQRVQNSAARIITRTKKSESITPHLIKLHWLPVKQRIEFKILTLTYRCLNDLGPSYLAELLKPYEPTRTLRSSSSQSLCVPKSKLKNYGDRAFAVAAPKLWNSLPGDLRSSSSLDSFKAALKTFLFKAAYKSEL
jgi:hypothetical protein